MIPESAGDVAAARAAYANGLAAVERAAPARARRARPATALLDELRWTNFLLAYQGEDDRALQARFASMVARLLDARAPAWLRRRCRARARRRAAEGRLRLDVLPRSHGGPLLRALDHRPAARPLRGVRVSPAARDESRWRSGSPRAPTTSAIARGGARRSWRRDPRRCARRARLSRARDGRDDVRARGAAARAAAVRRVGASGDDRARDDRRLLLECGDGAARTARRTTRSGS